MIDRQANRKTGIHEDRQTANRKTDKLKDRHVG